MGGGIIKGGRLDKKSFRLEVLNIIKGGRLDKKSFRPDRLDRYYYRRFRSPRSLPRGRHCVVEERCHLADSVLHHDLYIYIYMYKCVYIYIYIYIYV